MYEGFCFCLKGESGRLAGWHLDHRAWVVILVGEMVLKGLKLHSKDQVCFPLSLLPGEELSVYEDFCLSEGSLMDFSWD